MFSTNFKRHIKVTNSFYHSHIAVLSALTSFELQYYSVVSTLFAVIVQKVCRHIFRFCFFSFQRTLDFDGSLIKYLFKNYSFFIQENVEMRKGIMMCPVCQKETIVDSMRLFHLRFNCSVYNPLSHVSFSFHPMFLLITEKHLDINYIEADYYKAQDIVVKNHVPSFHNTFICFDVKHYLQSCDICLPESKELASQSEGSTSTTEAVGMHNSLKT